MSGAIVFPPNPTVGQIFTSGGTSWQWNGTQWVNAASGTAFLPLTGGTMSNPGTIYGATLAQPTGTLGVTNGSNAAAGAVGEYQTITGGPVTMTPGGGWVQASGALALAAGDWDVEGYCVYTVTTAVFNGGAWVVSTSNTTPTGPMGSFLSYVGGGTTAATTFTIGGPTARVRFSLTAATNLYLLATSTNNGGQVLANTGIFARRVR